MADAVAEPTSAQMIAQMQKAGYAPPQSAPTDLTSAQMIAEMSKAGFTPTQDSSFTGPAAQNSIEATMPKPDSSFGGQILSGLQKVNKDQATQAVASPQETVDALPQIGGTVGQLGGPIGAGIGSAAGSVAKDAINNWIFKGTKSTEDIAKDAALTGVANAAGSKAGELLGQGIMKAGKAIGGKLAEIGFQIPASVVERYAKFADVIGKMTGNADGDIAVASEKVKEGFRTSIDDFRNDMNSKITESLKGSTERVDPAEIIEKIQDLKGRMHGDMPGADTFRNQLAVWEQTISKMKDENGMIFAADMNQLKGGLQNAATAAYRNAGETASGGVAANALKEVAGVTRKIFNEAVPEVAAANNQLAYMHTLEDTMNKSLIREGTSEAPLLAAGKYAKNSAYGNARNALALTRLSKLTGEDFIGQAQNLAAMQMVGNSSFKRGIVGAGAGAALGASIGGIANGPEGAAYGAGIGGTLGGAVTSPIALRAAINAGRNISAPAFTMGAGLAGQTLGNSVMHGNSGVSAIQGNKP